MDILGFYARPASKKHLQDAVIGICTALYGEKATKEHSAAIKRQVHKIDDPETFFSKDNAEPTGPFAAVEDISPEVLIPQALGLLKLWQQTVLLPIDQMVMTIAMYLFTEPADLALAHKLAILLSSAASQNPNWELPDFCQELEEIAQNRYRLVGFSADDTGFDPDEHKGEVVIATMHKAKGLEWDRVYMLSVNNYNFPSAQEGDSYMSEKWFIRDRLNLEAEMIAQLKALVKKDKIALNMPEGQATVDARLDYASERLRLLYVGITRARRELVITRNTGRRGDSREALPLSALRTYMEQKNGH
jgi:DNA helicase-2/ATP-dependent DNA helicase PcrA